jgi:hypothetical protein
MSALPPKADIRPRDQDVCFGPIADSCSAVICVLFDHLVGAREQRGRYGETKSLSRLEVNHQLIFGRQLNWKIARLFAIEYASDINPSTAISIGLTRSIAQKSTGSRRLT